MAGRREVLCLLGVSILVPSVGACRSQEPQDRRTRLPISAAPLGARTRVEHAGHPVEVLRTKGGIVARSLVCTHFGCVVHWDAAQGRYLCACHGGAFDAQGRPVGGPPQRALDLVPVELTDDEIVVGLP